MRQDKQNTSGGLFKMPAPLFHLTNTQRAAINSSQQIFTLRWRLFADARRRNKTRSYYAIRR